MDTSPEELMTQAERLFNVRAAARAEDPWRNFYEEVPAGSHVLALENHRPGWWRFQIYLIAPSGRRVLMRGAGFRIRAESMPALAGMLSRALQATLSALPEWASSDQGGEAREAADGGPNAARRPLQPDEPSTTEALEGERRR
jgi:hypothetical protein